MPETLVLAARLGGIEIPEGDGLSEPSIVVQS